MLVVANLLNVHLIPIYSLVGSVKIMVWHAFNVFFPIKVTCVTCWKVNGIGYLGSHIYRLTSLAVYILYGHDTLEALHTLRVNNTKSHTWLGLSLLNTFWHKCIHYNYKCFTYLGYFSCNMKPTHWYLYC